MSRVGWSLARCCFTSPVWWRTAASRSRLRPIAVRANRARSRRRVRPANLLARAGCPTPPAFPPGRSRQPRECHGLSARSTCPVSRRPGQGCGRHCADNPLCASTSRIVAEARSAIRASITHDRSSSIFSWRLTIAGISTARSGLDDGVCEIGTTVITWSHLHW